jgi:integrase/recombinase XerD
MDSLVFTRHASDCKYKRDRLYRRCSCPKWVEARFNHERVRKSAATRLWEEADKFREKFEQALMTGQPLSSLHPDSPAARPSSPGLPAPPLPTAPLEPDAAACANIPSAPPAASGQREWTPATSQPPEILPAARQKVRVTVEKAVSAYMTDARSRQLKPDTISKLERIFEKQLLPWTKTEGIEFVDQLDLDALLTFRSTWHEGALVRAKKQERVKGFFWACFRRNFISQIPALGLSKIKTSQVPTDYFPQNEFDTILAALSRYGDPRGGFIDIEDTRTRLRTLTLLMRWSGLRIRDAITLERNRLHGDSLLLYQAKTGQPVYVPLPPYVVKALEAIPDGPVPNPRYFFWSGNGKPKSAVADWQRSYRRLFQLADIRKPDGKRKRCHPHMFRDTFAVEMLLAGVPIDQVSILLGHSSVKITEKHYAPFVKARQLQLQNSVRNAWKVGESPDPGPDNPPPNAGNLVGKPNGWGLIDNTKKKVKRA